MAEFLVSLFHDSLEIKVVITLFLTSTALKEKLKVVIC
ncbi:hypothetical protein LD85_2096 [Saccharolobus islandicus L.D.8.5]|uniref:Uncharacterized protein n=1 Tax=Saccharolobus islandicus (strain L.D.8.5 / Lassen \|nr:hypothetical protein LD85_2096 [Sulfolobus islandicus L.D.8.5]